MTDNSTQVNLMVPAVLKPCPFDGGKPDHHIVETYSLDSSYYVIGCTTCECQMVVEETLTQADVNAWNKRTGQK